MAAEYTSPRFHDLDAVRGLALLLGVALHASMSFLEPQVWVIKDASSEPGLGILFYVIHMFRMTTFFVMAGFFWSHAHGQAWPGWLHQKSPDPCRRTLHPVLAIGLRGDRDRDGDGLCTGRRVGGGTAAPSARPDGRHGAVDAFVFLYALLWFYAIVVVAKLLGDITRAGGPTGRIFDAVLRPLVRSDLIGAVLIAPAFAALYISPSWLAWFGIPTADTGLILNNPALAGYLTAFGFGWFLHRNADLLGHLAARWWAYLPAAVVGTVICLNLVGSVPVVVPVKASAHPLYLALYLLTGWSWTLGLIGAAHAFLKRENPVLRYLSDASYWVYIIHIPVVMGLQLAVRDLPAPAELKFAGVLLVTVMIGLATYQTMVRYSFVGGDSQRPPPQVKNTSAGGDGVSEKKDTFEADLAFMRSLVSEGSRAEMSGGIVFFGAGLFYGLQCLVQWADLVKLIRLNTFGHLSAAILPTVALLALVGWVMWRDRKQGPKGVATRALNAAFGSAGLANCFIVVVFGYWALNEKSFLIWALYPVVICAIQGAVWYTALYDPQEDMAGRCVRGLVHHHAGAGHAGKKSALCAGDRHCPDRPHVRVWPDHDEAGQKSRDMAGFDVNRLDDAIHGRLRLGSWPI